MKLLLTPDQMRNMEQRYMRETGVSSPQLMQRAARGIAHVLDELLHGARGKTAAFACGPGNNGGDGRMAAALFEEMGGRAQIWPDMPLEQIAKPDIWVDALFGIGLSRPPKAAYRAAIERINGDRLSGAKTLCVDVPSGLDARTGEILDFCVQADCVVSFGCAKAGFFLGDGPTMIGELRVWDIGIPDSFLPTDAARVMEWRDAALPPRPRQSHKNSYGHLLIVAGSRGMAGAAQLCTLAALRGGAGLVSVACPESLLPILQLAAPCAMCVPLPERDGALCGEALPLLAEALRGKSALAVGPGLSRRAHPDVIRLALESGLPAVLDADALNLIAENPALRALASPQCVLTPHPGEACRLLPGEGRDPVAWARALQSDLNATILLKGATSVVCGERTTLSASGTPGMAKGGSGDVLTGLLGALLAQGISSERAASMASELHGRAGEIAARRLGETAMNARDLIDALPEAFLGAAR